MQHHFDPPTQSVRYWYKLTEVMLSRWAAQYYVAMTLRTLMYWLITKPLTEVMLSRWAAQYYVAMTLYTFWLIAKSLTLVLNTGAIQD